ncbi:hypothetical protein BC829DRAFT_171076 [Chytridium lagenaria]|nr:hypothetical protein BC829DRAFT_171076 [Chytridium lagenaria]
MLCLRCHQSFGFMHGGSPGFSNTVYRFDTSTDSWIEPITPSGLEVAGRTLHACTVAGGVFYISGGLDKNGKELTDGLVAYFISTTSWYRFPTTSVSRSGHSLVPYGPTAPPSSSSLAKAPPPSPPPLHPHLPNNLHPLPPSNPQPPSLVTSPVSCTSHPKTRASFASSPPPIQPSLINSSTSTHTPNPGPTSAPHPQPPPPHPSPSFHTPPSSSSEETAPPPPVPPHSLHTMPSRIQAFPVHPIPST